MSTHNLLIHCSLFWQDHPFSGIEAGMVAALCINPLDLLKVRYQVSTRAPGGGGIGRGIWLALRDIYAREGWRGLYRGLGLNIAGNASSWGLRSLVRSFTHFLFFFLHLLLAVSPLFRRSESASSMSFDSPLFSPTSKSSSLL
jgi:Mitochondrial carrier protein